jgi:hypothetical protein
VIETADFPRSAASATNAAAFCRQWTRPHCSRRHRSCSAACNPAAGRRAGAVSTHSVGCGTQGTPRLRWRSDGPGPGPYINSQPHGRSSPNPNPDYSPSPRHRHPRSQRRAAPPIHSLTHNGHSLRNQPLRCLAAGALSPLGRALGAGCAALAGAVGDHADQLRLPPAGGDHPVGPLCRGQPQDRATHRPPRTSLAGLRSLIKSNK